MADTNTTPAAPPFHSHAFLAAGAALTAHKTTDDWGHDGYAIGPYFVRRVDGRRDWRVMQDGEWEIDLATLRDCRAWIAWQMS